MRREEGTLHGRRGGAGSRRARLEPCYPETAHMLNPLYYQGKDRRREIEREEAAFLPFGPRHDRDIPL